MKKKPFYFEIKDIMTQFVAAFNDIIINRHSKDKSVKSRVQVRYVYSPKQRVVHDIVNKARHITLPVVAVNITGISRDENRVFNKLEGAFFAAEETNPAYPRTELSQTTGHMPQPVPINIEVSMSMLARYQTDIEQIVSNFIPYNDPYIILSWKLPEGFAPTDQEIRSEVLWNGNLSMNYPDAIGGNEPYRISCDTAFTIKSWLFKEHANPQPNIFKITTNITPVPVIDASFSYTLPFYDDVTERSYIEGLGPTLTAAPFITHIDTVSGYSGQTSTNLLGYNFSSTTNVYVSSTNINTLSGSEVTPFTLAGLSSLYPPFTATEIDYKINNDNKLTIYLPEYTQIDNVDIIIQNAGGYDTALNSTLHGKGIMLNSDL